MKSSNQIKLEFNSLTIDSNPIFIKGQEVLVIHFVGQINNNNAFDISRKIQTIFESQNYNVIINLSKLTYINSVGVAMILTLIKTIDQYNGKLFIGGMNPFLDNVIKLMELPKKVRIYNTIEEAKSSWNQV
jgi:anti-anti-sigma factor